MVDIIQDGQSPETPADNRLTRRSLLVSVATTATLGLLSGCGIAQRSAESAARPTAETRPNMPVPKVTAPAVAKIDDQLSNEMRQRLMAHATQVVLMTKTALNPELFATATPDLIFGDIKEMAAKVKALRSDSNPSDRELSILGQVVEPNRRNNGFDYSINAEFLSTDPAILMVLGQRQRFNIQFQTYDVTPSDLRLNDLRNELPPKFDVAIHPSMMVKLADDEKRHAFASAIINVPDPANYASDHINMIPWLSESIPESRDNRIRPHKESTKIIEVYFPQFLHPYFARVTEDLTISERFRPV